MTVKDIIRELEKIKSKILQTDGEPYEIGQKDLTEYLLEWIKSNEQEIQD